MVSDVVGYLSRSYRVPGLFENTLSLGFQVVLVYLYKLKHRKKPVWLDLDLGLCLGEVGLAQCIRQDEKNGQLGHQICLGGEYYQRKIHRTLRRF